MVGLLAIEGVARVQPVGAAPRLLTMLAAEHAIPISELYPPGELAEGPHASKRWRIKAALIRALGLLGDPAACALIGRLLSAGRDFYIVNSVAAQALGRIRGPAARLDLAPALLDSELNTLRRAEYALAAIDA